MKEKYQNIIVIAGFVGFTCFIIFTMWIYKHPVPVNPPYFS